MSERTYNKDWFKNNKARKEHCLAIAENGERTFKEITGAKKTSLKEDKEHKDFLFEGKFVDVKGLKPMHLDGYILVEMINSYGYHGWCSEKSKADYIAFQFEDHFVVVGKNDLRELAIRLTPKFSYDTVHRENRVSPKDGLYRWLGRLGRRDIFTYLLVEDLKAIEHKILTYGN